MCDKNGLERMFTEDLLNKRIIYLEGDIVSEKARDIGKAIVWFNVKSETEEITLYIDSGGGDVAAGLDLYDAIKNSKAPVTGIVYRRANSMAALILQACKIKKAMQNTEIVIHYIRITRGLDELDEDLAKTLESSRRSQEIVFDIFSKKSKMSLKEVKQKCKEGKVITAEEAKSIGLIDELI